MFHRNGTQEYVSMDQFEGLISRDYIVAVDHEDRIVSAQRNAPLQSLNKLFDPEKIRELIQTQNASVQYVSSNGSWKGIEIIDPENTEEKLTLYFEPFSFILKEVRIATVDPFANTWEVTEGIMIVVRYLNYSTLAKPFPYKMENYIRKSGNHFVPSGKCKGYQLL